MAKLTLGTAHITPRGTECWKVTYMNVGSFLVGEQYFSSRFDAEQFCRERRIRVLEAETAH